MTAPTGRFSLRAAGAARADSASRCSFAVALGRAALDPPAAGVLAVMATFRVRGRQICGGRQCARSRRAAAVVRGGVGPVVVARAAHQPHLLRRADLPGHRAEPDRPEARADVQRRHGRVRAAAVLAQRIQQAAERLSLSAELVFRVRGVRGQYAHWLNVALSAATAGALFLLTLLLTGDRLSAGLRRRCSFALIPEQITVVARRPPCEPSAAFVVRLPSLCWPRRSRARGRRRHLCWGGVCRELCGVQFRPEIVPDPTGGRSDACGVWTVDELGRPRLWWVAVLGVLAARAVTFAHLAAVRSEGWGDQPISAVSLAYVAHNLRINGVVLSR